MADRVDGYPFDYLVDSPEDGGFEEHAWMPAPEGFGPEHVLEAFVIAFIEHPLEHIDHEMTLRLGPLEMHVAELLRWDDEDEEQELVGAAAVRYALENQAEESLRFRKLRDDEDEADAMAYWRIDVVEACAHLMGEDEDEIQIRCNLPAGHVGEHVRQKFLDPHP